MVEVDPLLERLARLGFLARGSVYLCIGTLAAQAAMGLGGRTTDPHGAVREMGRWDPSGVLLGLLAIGLLGYATWRLAAGILDLQRKGREPKGLAVRAGYIGLGLTHAALAFTAAGLTVEQLGRGSTGIRAWVARVIDHPLGVWVVGGAGLTVLGVGTYQFYKAWTVKFEEHVRTSSMSARARRWYRRLGRFGIAARGVTFIVIGLALLRAAARVDPSEAKGLADALRELQQTPHGWIWMGIVAVGLAAFGAMSVMEAKYRRLVE